ncbi:MAG: hypothetical protein ABI707_17345 [Ferruginibacter sp.]
MKASFKAPFSQADRPGLSLNELSFFSRNFHLLLLTACLVIGLTATKNATAGNSRHTPLTIDTIPVLTIIADYCVVAGKVRLTAASSPVGATYVWSTEQTGSVIDIDIANMYSVVATFSGGVTATASKKVAQELVTNGDFSAGNTGFFTEYGYADDIGGNSELNPEGLYGIGPNGQNYHSQFYGKEHTTSGQTGNFMIINGSTTPIGSPARQRVIWQQTVPVLPNTNYYFSAYAMNVNPGSPAQLQFEVNGVLVGTIADLNIAAKPNSDATVNINNWIRFYSNPTWVSGSTTTAVIRIINLNTTASGNDFGLDDISFSTLSPFITLVSPTGTDAQTTCINAPIAPIVYSVGSDASGHSILNLPPGVTASFGTANFLTISGIPTLAGNYTYSITTIGTCNPVTVTGTINIPSNSATWTGAVSNDWSDPNNWYCVTVPLATTNVVIATGVERMPMLTTASVCKLLNLQPATSLDLNGQHFTSYGGTTGTGVFKGSALSNLTIDAAGTNSTLLFDQSTPGAGNALYNLTITGLNNSVVLNTKLALYGVLAPQNGTLTINDTLILRSTSTGTARVGIVTGTFAYGSVGKVEVERYFPARRSWRLVTSPLAKSGSIFDTWQNGGKYTPGKGTYVSGVGASDPVGANGLDWSPLNNPSLKTGVTFTPILNTRVSLSKNNTDTSDNIPYFLFVRGDRDPANTNPYVTNNTTLSSAGKLQTGRQTFNAASALGGFTFIGNPYASPVDFNKLGLNNLKKHFFAWDPYLNTDQGGFILVEEITAGVYDMIPHSPAGLSQVLESSQGFFVETDSNSPASIIFQEAAKCNVAANLTAFRPLGLIQSFRTELYHLNENDNTLLLDGVMALFDTGFSKNVDNRDVLKQNNPKEMLALVRDTKTLALERRPLPDSDDTLFLQLTKTTQRRYRLQFEPRGLDPILTAFLDDKYTGVKTALSVTSNSLYDFEINAAAASADVNRFRILFKVAAPLPVTCKSISAKQQAENIAVDWIVENEINISKYEVERSSDGINFKKVNITKAMGTGRTMDYKWIDQNPLTSNNYYRVRSISPDGKYDYSKTVMVKFAIDYAGIQITPNPVTGDMIGVAFKNMPEGIYETRLLNALGQTLLTKQINHTTGNSPERIRPGNKLVAGIYELGLIKPDHSIITVKVIVQ